MATLAIDVADALPPWYEVATANSAAAAKELASLLQNFDNYDITERARTNHTFTRNSDVSAIHNLLLKGDIRMNWYSAEISRIQELLNEFQEQKEKLSRRILLSRSLLTSPIRRIPNEVLVHIFSLLGGDNGGVALEDDITIPYDPAILVCAHWRNLIVSTPSLWNKVTLALGYDWRASEASNPLLDKWRLEHVENALKRSKGCPLHIFLRFSKLYGSPAPIAINKLLLSSSQGSTLR